MDNSNNKPMKLSDALIFIYYDFDFKYISENNKELSRALDTIITSAKAVDLLLCNPESKEASKIIGRLKKREEEF